VICFGRKGGVWPRHFPRNRKKNSVAALNHCSLKAFRSWQDFLKLSIRLEKADGFQLDYAKAMMDVLLRIGDLRHSARQHSVVCRFFIRSEVLREQNTDCRPTAQFRSFSGWREIYSIFRFCSGSVSAPNALNMRNSQSLNFSGGVYLWCFVNGKLHAFVWFEYLWFTPDGISPRQIFGIPDNRTVLRWR